MPHEQHLIGDMRSCIDACARCAESCEQMAAVAYHDVPRMPARDLQSIAAMTACVVKDVPGDGTHIPDTVRTKMFQTYVAQWNTRR